MVVNEDKSKSLLNDSVQQDDEVTIDDDAEGGRKVLSLVRPAAFAWRISRQESKLRVSRNANTSITSLA